MAFEGKEETIKGYKVKVQYQPVVEAEKKTKWDAVGQVILQALKVGKREVTIKVDNFGERCKRLP